MNSFYETIDILAHTFNFVDDLYGLNSFYVFSKKKTHLFSVIFIFDVSGLFYFLYKKNVINV